MVHSRSENLKWTSLPTNGLHEVHECLAGDEAEYEADADVEGVAQGPHLGREELGHDDPDESAVPPVTEEQEDQDEKDEQDEQDEQAKQIWL